MIDAILFWMAKPLANMALALMAAIAVVAITAIAFLPSAIRQARCRHKEVYETRVREAVCTHCGKNLGFIGTWRERQKHKEHR